MRLTSEEIERNADAFVKFTTANDLTCTLIENIDGLESTVRLDYKEIQSFQKFLLQVKPTFVGLISTKIDELDYRDMIEKLKEVEPDNLEGLVALSDDVGKIGLLKIFFFTDSGKVLHSLTYKTKLYEAIYEEIAFNDRELFEEDDSISDQEMDQYAQKVANNPKLISLSTLAHIQTLLEKELKDVARTKRIYSVQKLEMARKALMIFKTEVEPGIEEDLAEKAIELRKQGLTKAEVAKKLKITPSKLNKII